MFDVIVVGAGPAGISTALHLTQTDPALAQRTLILEKAIHPRPKPCGGGVPPYGVDVLANLGLGFAVPHVKLHEVQVRYGTRHFDLRLPRAIHITHREEFDAWLLREVQERGVEVRQGEAVRDVRTGHDGVAVRTDRATYQAKVLVGADGSKGVVRRRLGLGGARAGRLARLVEILTPEDETTQPLFRDGVGVLDFSPMSDGIQGYIWDFPSRIGGQPYMNRGIYDSRAVRSHLCGHMLPVFREALRQRGVELDASAVEGYPIHCFSRDNVFSVPRALLVGDAAGSDGLLGEGITFALAYGRVAAEAIVDAITRGDFSFVTYRDRLLQDPLIRSLDLRNWLARVIYRLHSHTVLRLLWLPLRHIVRLFPETKSLDLEVRRDSLSRRLLASR
jgi:flavin-dependent dehydrogenase